MVLDVSGEIRDSFWEANVAVHDTTVNPAMDGTRASAASAASGRRRNTTGDRDRSNSNTRLPLPPKPSAQDSSTTKLQYIRAKYKDKSYIPAVYAGATQEDCDRNLQNCVLAGDVIGACKWLCAGGKVDRPRPIGAPGPSTAFNTSLKGCLLFWFAHLDFPLSLKSQILKVSIKGVLSVTKIILLQHL